MEYYLVFFFPQLVQPVIIKIAKTSSFDCFTWIHLISKTELKETTVSLATEEKLLMWHRKCTCKDSEVLNTLMWQHVAGLMWCLLGLFTEHAVNYCLAHEHIGTDFMWEIIMLAVEWFQILPHLVNMQAFRFLWYTSVETIEIGKTLYGILYITSSTACCGVIFFFCCSYVIGDQEWSTVTFKLNWKRSFFFL